MHDFGRDFVHDFGRGFVRDFGQITGQSICHYSYA